MGFYSINEKREQPQLQDIVFHCAVAFWVDRFKSKGRFFALQCLLTGTKMSPINKVIVEMFIGLKASLSSKQNANVYRQSYSVLLS